MTKREAASSLHEVEPRVVVSRDKIPTLADRCDRIARIMQRSMHDSKPMEVWLDDIHTVQDAAAALRLSAQQREPVVRVKGLEWSQEPPYHVARVRLGFYSIEYIESDDGGYFDLRGSLCRGAYRTLAEAKTAAQADYEQRIMAAIEIERLDRIASSGRRG